jgi:tetratricopeptide (TPR) repeat protein
MYLRGRRFQPTSEPPRLTIQRTAVYCAAILVGLAILKLFAMGIIRSPLASPPLPTRSAQSYAAEGQAFFDSGNMNKAIQAYENAVRVAPTNARNWQELARIQTYSSEMILGNQDKSNRLKQSLDSIEKACALDPEHGTNLAIRALVLDWSANPNLVDEATRADLLEEAYRSSVRALQLDPNNPLALAFQAEVLVDQANWTLALDIGARAADLAPNVMDVHRAFAYVLESNAYYSRAVEELLKAIDINPNLPFLYIRLGANYRKLGEIATNTLTSQEMMDKALEAFARAAELTPNDPLPYLSIANTYAYQGEYFAAELNAQKALSYDNTNAFIYGRLGVIYYKAKNYESAQKVLHCAVRGCTAAENEEQGVDVTGEPLTPSTLDVYYIYGSVSAFYSDCAEAAAIFAELRASPYYDPSIEDILREGEAICAAVARQTPTPTPTAVP